LSIASIISGRRTIRKFNPRPLVKEVIMDLLEVSVWAPNHGLREPWRFICAADLEAKTKLADLVVEGLETKKRYKWMPAGVKEAYKKKFTEIPAILFVVVKEESDKLKRDEDFAASCALIQNLQLYGWEQEIGMIWSIDESLCGNELFCTNLGLKKNERIAGMLYMGYFDRIPKAKQRTAAERKMVWL